LRKGNPAGKRSVKTRMHRQHNKMDKKLKKVVSLPALIQFI
jgi:hypothetical protein